MAKLSSCTVEYICDQCKRTFLAKDTKLIDPVDNITVAPFIGFVFVDKDGYIKTSFAEPSKALGDKLLSCPHCGDIQLSGFTPSRER